MKPKIWFVSFPRQVSSEDLFESWIKDKAFGYGGQEELYSFPGSIVCKRAAKEIWDAAFAAGQKAGKEGK